MSSSRRVGAFGGGGFTGFVLRSSQNDRTDENGSSVARAKRPDSRRYLQMSLANEKLTIFSAEGTGGGTFAIFLSN